MSTAAAAIQDLTQRGLHASEAARLAVSNAFEKGDENGRKTQIAEELVHYCERRLLELQRLPFQEPEDEHFQDQRMNIEVVLETSISEMKAAIKAIRDFEESRKSFEESRISWYNSNI